MNQSDKIWEFYNYNLHIKLFNNVVSISKYYKKIVYEEDSYEFSNRNYFQINKNLRRELDV